MQKLKIMLVKLLSVSMLFSSISFPSYATSIGANGGGGNDSTATGGGGSPGTITV